MLIHWKRIIIAALLLIFALLITFIPTFVSAYSPSDIQLPTPVPPEPYPNTDIYPAAVYLINEQALRSLLQVNIDIEGLQPVDGNWDYPNSTFEPSIATVYINSSLSNALLNIGLTPIPIPNEGYRSFVAFGPGSGVPNAWPTYDQYVLRMQTLEATHPTIVKLVSIGLSVQGRELWCMEISDHPNMSEEEPEVKYTANHHGDETIGVETTMRLAELLAGSYAIDPVLTDMVDKMEIWLCPIYNPDGYMSGSRYNANGVDLNRDFPDRITDPIDDPSGREPETQAFMNFSYNHRFSMGANFHGGAAVVNVPWDSVAGSEYAPDDQLFLDFGIGYASRNPRIWNGSFPQGVTRGWEWYIIRGGMQDWAYFWHNEHHVTIELATTKQPPFEQMDIFWEENRDAMLWWLQRAWTGLGGLVLDARNNDPLDATITLLNRDEPNTIATDPDAGDYHRVIEEGTYTLNASTDGYISQSMDVIVISDTVSSVDFYLCPEERHVVSGTITDAYTDLPLEAMVEFVDSRQVVNSDSETGGYSIDICPYSYTMRVSAPWYYPEVRTVNIDQDQVHDFALIPTANLSLSDKVTSASQPLPTDLVQYQLFVNNSIGTTSAYVTDTLPISVTWNGYLTSTQGISIFNSGQILWHGEVSQTQSVTITYAVNVNQCLTAGTPLLNIAEFDGGESIIITRKVQLEIANAEPTLPSLPFPGDGAINQPVNLTLTWNPSTDLNCDPITYEAYFGTSPTPPMVATGLTEPSYNPGPLRPATTYYWYVITKDGITQAFSPTWSFSTTPLKTFIPISLK